MTLTKVVKEHFDAWIDGMVLHVHVPCPLNHFPKRSRFRQSPLRTFPSGRPRLVERFRLVFAGGEHCTCDIGLL